MASYFAFISYKSEDRESAVRLHTLLESYNVPVYLREINPGLRDSLTPVFIDTLDLSLGDLEAEVYEALANSTYLINICSKRTPSSPWVGREISEFARINEDARSRIIPFIIDGTPDESFHPELKTVMGETEFLGANVNEVSFEYAAAKVIAYMLNLEVADVWDRYKKAVEEEKRRLLEEKRRLQRAESRYMAEKVENLYRQGDLHFARRLSLFGLPCDITDPDRPLVWQMEGAFRRLSHAFKATYKGINKYDPGHGINDICMSPDGRYIAAATHQHIVYLWDAWTGKLLQELPHRDEVWSAAFSNDSHKLATCSRESIIRIWDVEDYTCDVLVGHRGPVHSVKFSSDDLRLVSASYDHTVRLWDLQSLKCIRSIGEFAQSVNEVDLSSDDAYVLTMSYDGTKLWDLDNGKCVLTVPSYSSGRCVFSKDASICVIPQSEKVQIWDVASRTLRKEIPFDKYLKDLDLSPDGERLLILTSTGLSIWDLKTGERVNNLQGMIDNRKSRFAPGGEYVLFASGCDVFLQSLEESAPLASFKNASCCYCASVTRDGGILAVNDCDGVKIWDVNRRQIVDRLDGNIGLNLITKDGKSLICADYEENVQVINLETKQSRRIGRHEDYIHCMLMTSDETKVMTGSSDSTVKVWDVASGTCLKEYDFKGSPVASIAFGPGEKSLMVAADTSLYLVDLSDLSSEEPPLLIEDKSMPESEEKKESCCIRNVAMSHNGKYACVLKWDSIEGVDLWDMENMMLLNSFTLAVHSEPLGTSVLFSADDRNIIVSTDMGAIAVYSVENQKLLYDISAHDCEITRLLFMHDDRRFVSVGDDGTVKIWPFPPLQDLINETLDQYESYPLSEAEKKDLYIEE